MDNEPIPDHYKALGLDKTCDTEAVKKAHRKLVLHCHPDKVKDTDPLKEEKQTQFHVVQKAYEVLTDAKERAKYEALLTLQTLRREKLARGGADPSREKTARFDVRTAGGGATYQATGPPRYATEERRPSRAYDEDDKYYDDRDRERERDRPRASTRSKYDTYDAYPKPGSSPRTEKESSRTAKATAERSRADRNKARDKEDRRERKFVSVDSESSEPDEKTRHEAGYKRRSQEDEAQRQRQAADARRKADDRRSYEDTRKTDDRRSYEDSRYGASPTARKLSTQEEEAIRYLHKSRAQVEEAIRPTPARAASRDYYGESRPSRKESSRPETVRRSSARPKDRVSSSSGRDKGYPEIVSWGEDEGSSRRPPTLKAHNSSPANIEVPSSRSMPQRSYTTAEPSTRDHRSSTSPPGLLRAQTMPTKAVPPNAHPSSRSKPATVSRPSMLREQMMPEHTLDHEYATVPPPQSASKPSTKYYHYPTPNGSVPLRPEDISNSGHRTIVREPERTRKHSPDPLFSRPPIGANRPSEANIKSTVSPGRTSSRHASPERGRLYGEVRPRVTRQNSYAPSDVQYAHKYGPEDVRWAPRKGENESSRGFEGGSKPAFLRTATYAY
ncbi:DnaJ-domain-containing protein [Ophiobolus disseminans]|uniref:DnaJ-domain-containing protein n=1 Tax=Ophiobolus disseminans TaxID=1469910 RepID=A0A6A6ZV35_9PLEO|nr:DnaJ-domain-containing protein [Ophiobolus disseminans]